MNRQALARQSGWHAQVKRGVPSLRKRATGMTMSQFSKRARALLKTSERAALAGPFKRGGRGDGRVVRPT